MIVYNYDADLELSDTCVRDEGIDTHEDASVPVRLAQCWITGLAISDAKM